MKTVNNPQSLDNQDLCALEELRLARRGIYKLSAARAWFLTTYHIVGLYGDPTEDMLFALRAARLMGEAQADLENPEHPYNVLLAFLEAAGLFKGEPRSQHPTYIWEQAQAYWGEHFLEGLKIAFYRTLDFYATPQALYAAMTPYEP